MFKLIFPTLKVINYYHGSHQGQLFIFYRTAQSFSSKFHRVFQSQTKLFETKKQKKKQHQLGRRKITG